MMVSKINGIINFLINFLSKIYKIEIKNNLDIKVPATLSSPKGPLNLLPCEDWILLPNISTKKKFWINISIITNKTKKKIIFENTILKSLISFKQKSIIKNKI